VALLAMIDVEVVDAQGNRNPIALDVIHFTLAGEGEWRGGIAQGENNYILSKELPVENGVNRVLIRSTPKAGKIYLKADSDNLKSVSIELNTKPFLETNGLSVEMPGTNGTAPATVDVWTAGTMPRKGAKEPEVDLPSRGNNVQ
jgi:beta-galactosidase